MPVICRRPDDLVLGAIEIEAEVSDAAGRRAGRGGALMPRCDAFSSPIISDGDAAHLVGRPRAGDERLDLRPRRGPVDAVERRVEEVVAQQAPRLVEDDRLLLREVDVHLRGDGDGARLARCRASTAWIRPSSR